MELYSYSVYVTCYLLPPIFQFHGLTSNMIFQFEGKQITLNENVYIHSEKWQIWRIYCTIMKKLLLLDFYVILLAALELYFSPHVPNIIWRL